MDTCEAVDVHGCWRGCRALSSFHVMEDVKARCLLDDTPTGPQGWTLSPWCPAGPLPGDGGKKKGGGGSHDLAWDGSSRSAIQEQRQTTYCLLLSSETFGEMCFEKNNLTLDYWTCIELKSKHMLLWMLCKQGWWVYFEQEGLVFIEVWKYISYNAIKCKTVTSPPVSSGVIRCQRLESMIVWFC